MALKEKWISIHWCQRKKSHASALIHRISIKFWSFLFRNENVIAVAYMDSLTFDERINTTGDERGNDTKGQFESSIVFWNFSDNQNPHAEIKLWSPVDITVFEIQPGNPNFVVAGAYNGQVIVYNKSSDAQQMTSSSSKEVKTLKYRAISPPDNSHKAPVTDIKFLPASLGYRRLGERTFNCLNSLRNRRSKRLCVLYDSGIWWTGLYLG